MLTPAEYLDLAVRARALCGDRIKVPDFAGTAESVDIFRDEIDHLIEPLHERERGTRKRLDECRADSIALSVPLVLLGDGAADAVEPGVKRTVAVERADKAAEQRGNGNCIVKASAAVGDPELNGRVVE